MCVCVCVCVCVGEGGVSIAQLVEDWTFDWKVTGLTAGRNGMRIFFSIVNFLC